MRDLSPGNNWECNSVPRTAYGKDVPLSSWGWGQTHFGSLFWLNFCLLLPTCCHVSFTPPSPPLHSPSWARIPPHSQTQTCRFHHLQPCSNTQIILVPEAVCLFFQSEIYCNIMRPELMFAGGGKWCLCVVCCCGSIFWAAKALFWMGTRPLHFQVSN